jgi:hypothetical protein
VSTRRLDKAGALTQRDGQMHGKVGPSAKELRHYRYWIHTNPRSVCRWFTTYIIS